MKTGRRRRGEEKIYSPCIERLRIREKEPWEKRVNLRTLRKGVTREERKEKKRQREKGKERKS